MRRIFLFVFLFSPNEQRGEWGGGALLEFFSPVQQTTSGIGHSVKVVFRVGSQYAECEKQHCPPALTGGCSEGLDAFRFFFKQHSTIDSDSPII